MATTKTLTPTNQAITLAAFTEKPDNRTNVTNDDKLADAVNALNSEITNIFAQPVSLTTYDNSSEQTLTLSEPASNFLFLSIRLHGSDGSMVGSCTLPTILLRNLTAKIYGESSAQWGSALLSSDYTQMTFNRTSANTTRITVYGNIRIQ